MLCNKALNLLEQEFPLIENQMQCMRCGFCLPTCPTYALTGRERSSPRGRIALTKAVAEGKLEFSKAIADEVFFCLDCRACTSVCPSGVRVGEIMELYRNKVRKKESRTNQSSWLRKFVLEKMLPHPKFLEASTLPIILYQRLAIQWLIRNSGALKLVPDWMQRAEALLPNFSRPLRPQIPQTTAPVGNKRGRVGFFLGCAMSLIFPNVSSKTIALLAGQGFEVITPEDIKCCGAPHVNEGDRNTARKLAVHNMEILLALDVDFILTDCAACGAMLKEYEGLLNSSHKDDAAAFKEKIRDISEFLASIDSRTDNWQPINRTVTFHDPCHLCHAQGISNEPRQLLAKIPGLAVKEMRESSWCCGSAATWGIKNTKESKKLINRKLKNIQATNADMVVTANPGCQLQLEWGVNHADMEQQVVHIVELLAESCCPES